MQLHNFASHFIIKLDMPKSKTEQKVPSTRTSFSLPETTLIELERIAKSQQRSVAWVIRDAIDQYLSDLYPLLSQGKGKDSR